MALRTVLALVALLSFCPRKARAVEPNANVHGTLGLGQIVSAEAMGPGRFTVQARGTYFPQTRTYPGAPPGETQVSTFTGALAYGVNPYVDVFVGAAGYALTGSDASGVDGAGPGTVSGGVQASIPFSEAIPARVGLQLALLGGTAGDPVNDNGADGYTYFETRDGTDFVARLTQTFRFEGKALSVRLHLNEGVATSLEAGKYALLLQGAGLEVSPHPSFLLGAELHSRTFFKDSRSDDPIWVAPSATFRSQGRLNTQVGAEIALSGDREGSRARALEPWRLFASLTYSIARVDEAGARK